MMARRLAVIMAGDVVGYSRRMAEDEAGTLDELRAAMAEIVTPAIAARAGRVFKTTGDGFLAIFASVGDALAAATAIQQGFAERSLKLRLGLNLGDVIEENGDVFGDGVNVAARLESMAEPGTVYVSAAVARGAGRKPGVRFERVGRKHAKNLPGTIEVFAVRPLAPRRSLPHGRALAAGIAACLLVGGALQLGGVPGFVRDAASTLWGVEEEAERPAVAVLPFDNLSGDPSQDYFTDGLTEDIITELARNRELLVIARNSTFAFKGRSADVRSIGRQLNAAYVVEGSARRAGDQLRVVAQLIDARTGTHLWSMSYDRRLEDVFTVQDELTTQIVASLASYVSRSEAAAVAERPTTSLRAYDLVLQGRERYQHGAADPKALLAARDLFRRAVELDPGYAVAHAHLGLTYIVDHISNLTGTASRQGLDEGLTHAREAIRLEPDLDFGYQVLSYGLAAAGDYEGALRAAQRSVELNPSDPDSLMSLAKAEVRFGAYPEAVAHAERALRLHPFAPQHYPYVYGQALYAAGRFADADRVLGDCLIRVPEERNCLRIQVAVLVRLERLDEAHDMVARLVAIDPAFSIAAERAVKRFGDSPVMVSYLADLATAGAPAMAGQAILGNPWQGLPNKSA
jgi:adenylate cyclase